MSVFSFISFTQFGNGINIYGLNNVDGFLETFYDNLPPTEQFIENFYLNTLFSLFISL
jgi:hypothetical protein